MEDGQRLIERSLYDPLFEHDACGVGFVVRVDGSKSHEIVEQGIQLLENLKHRGASGGDDKTGDGAGILVQVPDRLFRAECSAKGIRLPAQSLYGVGMAFLPGDADKAAACRKAVERVSDDEEFEFLGWRRVPVDESSLGERARQECPTIFQFFVGCQCADDAALERKLYVLRRQAENAVAKLSGCEAFYVASLSGRTIIYKGMMMGNQVSQFYPDLRDPEFVSGIAVIHQRYSTNTFPSWKLAQPFRFLAHNGEINTLRGNINQMRAREKRLESPLFGSDIKKLLPVIDETGSDSACLDNALELLVKGGRELPHAMLMLIPQAWGQKYPIGPDLRGFFEYHAGLMEPWDGPAAVAFTDGTTVGAMLDRNGLRPARYTLTKDGLMVLASETGVLDIPADSVIEKGALGPGQMILVDTGRQRVVKNGEIKSVYMRRQPYRRWVEENKITLHGFFGAIAPVVPDSATIGARQKLFGYSREELNLVIGPMGSSAHEPIGSMGYDAPLAVLSEQPQLLYSYFKQLFAQVTNPPIDPIREELVMSLMTFMGNPGNILADNPGNCRLIKLRHPVMSNEDLDRMQAMASRGFKSFTIPIGFRADAGGAGLEAALETVCREAGTAAGGEKALLVLSDRNLPPGVVPIPALLAVSAVNRHLSRLGQRAQSSIIVETGEARDVHHIALLLGYGATAVNPYLAFETVADMAIRKVLDTDIGVTKALENYIDALCKGLLKIMSKMGISTMRSYRGAQVFEAVGLERGLIDKYFPGTPSRVSGIGMDDIAAECVARFKQATDDSPGVSPLLSAGGAYRFRKDGERHLWTPESISALQLATRRNDIDLFRRYSKMIDDQTVAQSTLRGLFKFKPSVPVPLDEVEPAADIMKRFATSAMSFGSLSKEAHETLAVAMNRIGAMSNSGEGGEDPARYKTQANGDSSCSAVKQIASGRFGVTIEYLVSARELQIKIAQGAKPGEGGQLPGHKVNAEIARVRHSTPGVTLISPPPHHDIYSIEDIKQLIYDLKNANPSARVSVKLVSEVGVGTVAAGVAKAHADMILISGGDGGTGASPLSSIRHAGAPWELGLAETQQTLVLNSLRSRVRLQADGQMKTARDIVIAALLGAEEFGFATAPLVVSGCVMMRKCHQNTCPVGVATQDPELRKLYSGKPEYLVNFFRMLAEEIRVHMAGLGFRKMDDMIGRAELLEVNAAIHFWKSRGLDFSRLLAVPAYGDESSRRCAGKQNHEIDDVLDRELIRRAEPVLAGGGNVRIELPIRNINRTTGAMLSGEIVRRRGSGQLQDDSIVCAFNGAAGQSFGAFAAKGLTLSLEGEANDYVGKGLSGGRILITPPRNASYDPAQNVICGNVALYGATSGEAYICGLAGERFAIRNSGAISVVEGIGDHGCEYMTGGRVVILGETGVNFGAGMSGGIAYVYDEDSSFDGKCNLDMVDLELLEGHADERELKRLIERHHQFTGSKKARHILDNWETSASLFVKVFPMEYRKALGQMMQEDADTEREEVVHG